jgi:hypothetical protein
MAASKSMNKVVLFCGGLAGAGGEERLLWEEEKFFRVKGIETIVLTFSFDKSALYDYQPEKLEVIEAEPSFVSRIIALRRRLYTIYFNTIHCTSSWHALLVHWGYLEIRPHTQKGILSDKRIRCRSQRIYTFAPSV